MDYNDANSYLFVNGMNIIKFKAKDSEIVATPLCLGKISKDFFVDNMKKTGLYGFVYGFSVVHDVIAVDDMLEIHKYLIKKNNIIKNVWVYKKYLFFKNDFFNCNVVDAIPFKCVSMNNPECKTRPKIKNINSNAPSL